MFSNSKCSAFHSIAVVLCLSAVTIAQDLAAKGLGPLGALRAEYDEATKAWQEKYSGLRTTPSAELIERYDAWPAWSFLPRIVKLGTTDPKAPYSFDALQWAAVELANGVGTADLEYYPYDEPIFSALRKDHLSNPHIVDLFSNCSHYPTPARQKFLSECSENGSTRDVRGLASYYLAELLRNKGELASHVRSVRPDTFEPFQKHVWERRSPQYVSFLGSVDSDKAFEESKSIEQRVLDEFEDVEWLHEHPLAGGKPTLGFMIRLQRAHLSAPKVGEPAPDIASKDLTGVERKLGDYHGKVVVLHFWATWCPPCVEKIPQLLKLSQQHDARHFCILGINYDRERETAVKFVKEKEMAWPSWSAIDIGASIGRLMPVGTSGDVIVIDHKGVLRYHDPKGDDLDKAVESLLQEAAQGEPKR